MFGFIIGLLFLGIVAGYVARFLVPGPDPMSFAGTMLLGVAGSFIGGFLGWLVFGNKAGALEPAGIIGSVIGAVIVLIAYNATTRGRTTDI
ncbi:MAG TPA: GlsB/YeaQ/YmgE family stress response membrane protein [Acidimicrobiales bacterium]